MWEAQFGDFINGAQIIIDQYIVAAEDKWGQNNGLGAPAAARLRGAGSGALSSARIERFLILAAEDNMQLVNATTASQYFHLLRRQVHQERHTPLVVFTPKQGLRMKQTRSRIDELTPVRSRRSSTTRHVGRGPIDADRAPGRVLLGQGRVGRDDRARRARRPGRRRPGRAAVPAARSSRCSSSASSVTPTRASCAGSRRSPRTWARGTFIEHRTWRVKELGYDIDVTSPASSRAARPPAPRRSTTKSSPTSWKTPSPTSDVGRVGLTIPQLATGRVRPSTRCRLPGELHSGTTVGPVRRRCRRCRTASRRRVPRRRTRVNGSGSADGAAGGACDLR